MARTNYWRKGATALILLLFFGSSIALIQLFKENTQSKTEVAQLLAKGQPVNFDRMPSSNEGKC